MSNLVGVFTVGVINLVVAYVLHNGLCSNQY